jgi:cytidyltransferase-like protein
VLLGSFDPLHRGHGWVVRHLLRRFDQVLLLVPAVHFEKRVRFPQNATLAQRVRLIERVHGPGGPVLAGITREVLFLRLDAVLARRFPARAVGFAMGQDTHRKLLGSARYHARLGLAWGPAEQRALERLLPRVTVLDREDCPLGPAISSTRVRRLAAALQARGAASAEWLRALEPLVQPAVIDFIREQGLYRQVGNAGRLPAEVSQR